MSGFNNSANTARCWANRKISMAFMLLLSVVFVSRLPAQQPSTKAPAKASGSESVILQTKDGVSLHCDYYEGGKSTQTIPVILVHGFKGQSGEWGATAKKLQAAGHSVIVPDLRGHGKSTKKTNPNGKPSPQIRADKLRRLDFENMVTKDLEAVKRFLMKKHNNEELNIDMLTVVGSQLGSVVSALWTAQDWSWPPVAGQKQGQDVKAIVLLSPISSHKGLSLLNAIKMSPFDEIAALVVYGKQGKVGEGAHRMCKTLKRGQINQAESRVFDWGVETKLQGPKLLQERKLEIDGGILQFIDAQVKQRADEFAYKKRESHS